MQHLSDFFMMRSGSLASNVDKKIDMYKSYTWDPALIIISSCNVPSLANLGGRGFEASVSSSSAQSCSAPAHSHNRNRLYRWGCSLLIDKRLQQLPHQGEHRPDALDSAQSSESWQHAAVVLVVSKSANTAILTRACSVHIPTVTRSVASPPA